MCRYGDVWRCMMLGQERQLWILKLRRGFCNYKYLELIYFEGAFCFLVCLQLSLNLHRSNILHMNKEKYSKLPEECALLLVSLTALGCKSISNGGDERAFCLLRYSIKRISYLQLFPRHSRSCLESKPTFPPPAHKAKMYNANVVVSLLLFLRGVVGVKRGRTLPITLTNEKVSWIKHYTSLLMVFIFFCSWIWCL